MLEKEFLKIIHLIKKSHNNALRAVNAELINPHWNVGKNIGAKVFSVKWGEKTVNELDNFIEREYCEIRGFNLCGIYRDF